MSTNQLKDDLNINPNDLDEEILKQGGLFNHYAEMKVAADSAAKLKKLEFEVYAAALYAQVRDHYVARKEKPTEAQIESARYGNAGYVQRKKDVIEAEARVDQLKAILSALDQKKDMLVTFSANVRSEKSAYFAIRNQGDNTGRASIGTVPVSAPPG